jgi:hypothetical protein
MKYIIMNDGSQNRAERRKSFHDKVNNRDARRMAHRMNQPERMELISNGHYKLTQFFNIA